LRVRTRKPNQSRAKATEASSFNNDVARKGVRKKQGWQSEKIDAKVCKRIDGCAAGIRVLRNVYLGREMQVIEGDRR
jgi:hypothetical protein